MLKFEYRIEYITKAAENQYVLYMQGKLWMIFMRGLTKFEERFIVYIHDKEIDFAPVEIAELSRGQKEAIYA